MKKRILVVDDEESVCWALRTALSREGFDVAVASSAEEALECAAQTSPNAIVLDVRLPGMDGISALSELRQRTDDAPVVVITAHGNLDTAVRAVENGAFEYLAKPFDLDQALDAVRRATQVRRRREETGQSEESPPPPPEEMIGRSAAMQLVFKRIAMVAPHDSCVLITGESGTGKELVARAVHRFSARRDKPFLPVNVAALNPSLVESELFGHVKGAFTGASDARPGLLALADGGSVFLDELADIPLQVQVKLLRVLEHREMFPVGASQAIPLNVRILAATHQNLDQKVANGEFRHDLFFRLNVFQIHLPRLHERGADVALLAEHFLRQLQPNALPLAPETQSWLEDHSWPGNVRELRNALEHAVIVSRGSPLLPEHLPRTSTYSAESDGPAKLDTAVRDWLNQHIGDAEKPEQLYAALLASVEPALLMDVMDRVQGNRWMAAQWLGLNRATVRKKLKMYGLNGEEQS